MLFSSLLLGDDVEEGLSQYQKGDFTKAVELYKRACESANAEGCVKLGFMYYQGKGVKQDDAKAIEFYTKACDSEHAPLCYHLGMIHYSAQGVKEDKKRAKYFLGKACDAKFEPACGIYQELSDAGY